MSQLLSEDVIAVPPLSLRDIERRSAEVRALLVSLTRPEGPALPWDALVDRHLPRAGLLFYPASGAELRDCEAATDPSGETSIHILMRAELYEALTDPGPGGNRARATVAHELGHAVLHVPYIRQQRQQGHEKALVRVTRAQLAPYRDPEWQAWAFAGCLLMPRGSLESMQGRSLVDVARVHGVSTQFAAAHCARLKVPVGATEPDERASRPSPGRTVEAPLLLARRSQTSIARTPRAR